MPLTRVEALHIGNFLAPMLGQNPNAMLTVLFPDTALPLIAAGEGASPVVAWLTQLDDQQLGNVLELTEDNRHADAARARLAQQQLQASAVDPFDAEMLDNGFAFLNRADLRVRLKEMAAPDRQDQARILVVRGARSTGKTFTTKIMAHAARQSGSPPGAHPPGPGVSFDPHYCDLLDGAGNARAVVQFLATGISIPASGNVPKNEDSTEPFGHKLLAKWLVSLAKQTEGCHWLVIDNVERSVTGQDWKEPFIIELALQTIKYAKDPEGPRLVLLDHYKPLHFDCRPHTREVELDEIDLEDVRAFLEGRIAAESISDVIAKARGMPRDSDWLARVQHLVTTVTQGET